MRCRFRFCAFARFLIRDTITPAATAAIIAPIRMPSANPPMPKSPPTATVSGVGDGAMLTVASGDGVCVGSGVCEGAGLTDGVAPVSCFCAGVGVESGTGLIPCVSPRILMLLTPTRTHPRRRAQTSSWSCRAGCGHMRAARRIAPATKPHC
ncbi:hypothetical protein SDC9_92630 [bioreactor metagenome]|uniref:Uncharacterized protein n=1 Tax=bioreactor metagenome TaxID=1076179 RepID=A0A644ZZR0_9ZZZZ